ncbi:PIN domain-containing protein [Sphingomonas sp. ST-64]|uniref:PIN domain-containing protein n=1 Tax=Sphingomonas plantiphila TaxID=3163295 RepID=A0ABW8YSP1_9SPHN
MAKPRRYAWDSCAWIATITQEQSPLKDGSIEDRARLCNHVIELATRRNVEIATSGLALAEVCKNDEVKSQDGDTLQDFFRNEYILIVPVDRYVGTLAREYMQAGYAGLKPPDAVHLATAVVAEVSEFHTFDDKLLKLDGKISLPGGGVLKIRKPPAPPEDLFNR